MFLAYVGEEEGLRYQLVAGGIVAVVVVLAAVIVLTVVFVRSRSNDECNKKQPSDCDTLEYRNGEGKFPFFLLIRHKYIIFLFFTHTNLLLKPSFT